MGLLLLVSSICSIRIRRGILQFFCGSVVMVVGKGIFKTNFTNWIVVDKEKSKIIKLSNGITWFMNGRKWSTWIRFVKMVWIFVLFCYFCSCCFSQFVLDFFLFFFWDDNGHCQTNQLMMMMMIQMNRIVLRLFCVIGSSKKKTKRFDFVVDFQSL